MSSIGETCPLSMVDKTAFYGENEEDSYPEG